MQLRGARAGLVKTPDDNLDIDTRNPRRKFARETEGCGSASHRRSPGPRRPAATRRREVKSSAGQREIERGCAPVRYAESGQFRLGARLAAGSMK